MADNTRLNPGVGGDLVAMDDVGGVKFQRVKLTFGAEGVAGDVEDANPVPVEIKGGSVAARSTTTGTSDGVLLAANDDRIDAKFHNDSDAYYLLGEGTTPTGVDSYTVRIAPGGLYVTDFKGQLRGMFASAPSTGKLRITETS